MNAAGRGSALARAPGPIGRIRRGMRSRTVRRLLGHRMFVAGALLCLLVLLVALLADLIAQHDPNRSAFRVRLQPPSLAFPFGTDEFGRDLLARVVHGARLSLLVGFSVVLLNGVGGTLLGAIAGYFNRLDGPIMRVMDAMMAFPVILLALAITAALGPSLLNVVIALAVAYLPRTARVVRASVLVAREAEYVEAARAYGAGDFRILLREILPNCTAPLIVQLTFIFAYAVLAEAMLSFLGMGPPPPTPTWGNVIADGRNYLRDYPWISAIPGLAIALTVLGLNLVGDGLRDVFDPRLKVENG